MINMEFDRRCNSVLPDRGKAALPRSLFVITIGVISICAVARLHGASGLGWRANPGYRNAVVTPAKPGKVGFTLLAPRDTGVAFTNRLSDSSAVENQIRLIGSGVALGDVDGDGWC